MLWNATLMATGPDPKGLVLYLPLEDAKKPVDASANPTTVAVHGTLNLVDGRFGSKALQFNGNNANLLEVADAAKLSGMTALTLEAWIFPRNVASHEGMAIISKRVANLNGDVYNLFVYTGHLVNGRVNANSTSTNIGLSKTVIADNTWYHLALVFDAKAATNEKIKLYVNGVMESSATHPSTAVNVSTAPTWIGELDSARGFAWDGTLDEIGVWNIALTQAEVTQVMVEGKAKLLNKGGATKPSPADGSSDRLVTSDIAWTAGQYAATHNVYFGSSWADVDAANPAILVGKGLVRDVNTLDVGRLDFGRTYYWRVDEVNAAPDNTLYKGSVWSFTAEPYAYPIKPAAATASSAQMGMGPEKTIDGSGLTGDLHGTDGTTMWLSSGAQPNWIQYEFDKVYKLYDLKVWNSNQLIEAFIGFGAKKVTVEYSADGTTWTALANVPEFARAPGAPGYAANTTVNLGGIMAQYVKLTINSNWGGLGTITSLSEVRFSYVPVQAREPQPATAATGISVDTSLNWRAGRAAGSHKVFLGTDQAAVVNGTVAAQTVADHSFTPGSLTFGTTYYWKVDEVNTVTYPGDLWSFTTQEYAVVDDFEGYNDDDNRIYDAWIDGYTDGKSGSVVGYLSAPFAERTIIHGGRQAMPFEYNNVKAPYYSEATRTFDAPQNWTTNGADTVSLYFRGRAAGFADNGNGTFTMSSSGTDIWNNGDQFRFAYKTLNGDGSIVARVDSIVNTNVWAKGGVMIRQSIDPGSTHAFMPITPGGSGAGNGASFQRRLTAAGASTNDDNAAPAVAAPYWVKVERKGNSFTGSISPDGKTWTPLGAAQTITMTNPVLIGLALCSHDAALTTVAGFSNVSTTGTVTGSWQDLAIGMAMPTNGAAPLYLTVQDKAGKTKMVVNPNPSASATAAWTEWRIPLSDLTGVSLTAVQKITLGVGDKASPKAGAAGMLYFDDIGYGHPAP
jgi:hypothetical protein